MGIDEAVRMAVDECIKEEIMAEFFNEHREEIVGASIWEFNQELNDQAKYEDGYDDGRQEASLKIARGLIEILDIATIAEKTGLTEDEVRGLVGSKA